jgi:hypothetical protein
MWQRMKVRMTVLIPFNGMYAKDTADVEYDAQVKGWEAKGLVRVAKSDLPKRERRGTGKARQGTAEPSAARRKTIRAGDSSPSGDEPGEGFGAGGYGAFEG